MCRGRCGTPQCPWSRNGQTPLQQRSFRCLRRRVLARPPLILPFSGQGFYGARTNVHRVGGSRCMTRTIDYELVERARAAGFAQPPARKVNCPIVDIHTHTWSVEAARPLVEAARLYGIQRLGVITTLEEGIALQRTFPETRLIAWLDWNCADDPKKFADVNRRIVREAAAAGARLIKMWFAPRFYDRHNWRMNDPRLDPVFEEISRQKLGVLVHVADPDKWFERVYTDKERYGTKAEQYRQLTDRLAAHPDIPILVAHMGGNPEHLDELGALLDRYPNMYVDTSATRWIVRELGRQPDAARAFFAKYKDRILFGTDQVATQNPEPFRYTSRYWIHQLFWETDVVCPLPIDDADADGEPLLQGINLPEDVLPWIYYRNAQRVFGIDVPDGAAP